MIEIVHQLVAICLRNSSAQPGPFSGGMALFLLAGFFSAAHATEIEAEPARPTVDTTVSQPAAQTPEMKSDSPPKLYTNEDYIDDIARNPTFDIDNSNSVLGFIFSQLPPTVHVYPTENYYYFRFHYRGVPYAGNLRLAADERDQGNLSFAYFRDYQGWFSEEAGYYSVLNAKDGVQVEKISKLHYRVSYNGKTVEFHLNDLTGVEPSNGKMRKAEQYIGPVFDESGIQFFLVYNPEVKVFHYILRETKDMPERLFPSVVSDRILIGNRTGFAFYKDKHEDRKILIGVHSANSSVNNYFDGPFDQLPDNFIEGNTLKDAILDSDPYAGDDMDRYGNAPDKNNRYMIAPYRHYWVEDDLLGFDQCAEQWKASDTEDYYGCFIALDEQ